LDDATAMAAAAAAKTKAESMPAPAPVYSTKAASFKFEAPEEVISTDQTLAAPSDNRSVAGDSLVVDDLTLGLSENGQ